MRAPVAAGPLDLAGLRAEVAAGAIDEVAVALVDMQGRLQGSRLGAAHFLEEVLERGFPACVYLLAADVDMAPVEGGALSPSARGFGDLLLRPDLEALRQLPWSPGTALCVADAEWPNGDPVEVSPRRILRRQLARLHEAGLRALVGIELEWIAFRDSYQRAWRRDYRELRPASRHNVDYALGGLGDLERLARRIRREATAAGLRLESARGECHPGQYEIVFRYDDALASCDAHVLYKSAAKEIAAQEGMSLTFMAKYDAGEGSSCHVHLSLRSPDDDPAMARPGDGGLSTLGEAVVAGQLACMRDLTLLFAPNVNSYKRLRPGSFAPSRVSWGPDDRTRAVRLVGSGASLRIEHRVPGADANPYLAVAAMIAACLHGAERGLRLDEGAGAASDRAAPRLPEGLRAAADRFRASEMAREAFGDEVVEHYARAARAEAELFDSTVTEWERRRGFERL